MQGALFVADGDGRDAAAPVDGVVDGDVVDADDAEDVLNAEGAQGFVDGFAAGHAAHGSPPGHFRPRPNQKCPEAIARDEPVSNA